LPLALAMVIVAGAWVIGGRQGFDRIGTGGQNLRLLPKIGDAAPDFVAPTVDGQLVRLSDLLGQPVWLNFWGSWCPPCRSEFPEMQAAYTSALQPQGVVVLAISLDEPAEAAASFAARNNGTFPILTDPNRSFTGTAYPITNFPTHILIDREGIVRDVVLAPIDEAEIVRRAQAIIAPDEDS
jgi:peroxiredoxin